LEGSKTSEKLLDSAKEHKSQSSGISVIINKFTSQKKKTPSTSRSFEKKKGQKEHSNSLGWDAVVDVSEVRLRAVVDDLFGDEAKGGPPAQHKKCLADRGICLDVVVRER
jgi:hypothetical protein